MTERPHEADPGFSPHLPAIGVAPAVLAAAPLAPNRPGPVYPSGLVAFLFTDIEGSTRLWERDPDAMWRSLGRHNDLLAAAVAANGGVWFKTVGDAMQAAFPGVPAALAAAVDGQRALEAEPWPDTGPVRVRMAIHAGEAAPDGGDYLAPCLNRLSRLLSAGFGGQILLTGYARSLLDGRLPSGVALRDLGRHRLRDLLEPEQVWQPVIPGLPDAFPPLNSLERHPTNLPVQPAALIGRDDDLAALLRTIADPVTRLLTITGPGGTGKTRLALQVAADALDAFEDGAFLVDLAPVADPALLLPRIAATLGVREGGGQSLEDALAAYLADRRLLLLLDNLEQFRPQAAAGRAIADLLAGAPRLAILATSRAPVRIRAEREWPIAGLAVPDELGAAPERVAANPAVALFVERARAARPAFALDEGNAADIAAICAGLDGLPLAIELAAARVRALSPAEIRARLDGRLDLLASRAPDRPDRQHTLAATIDWSYSLLDPGLQVLFRRFAVFAGGADLTAIEAVTTDLGGGQVDALDGITLLIEESLVRAEEPAAGQTRYRMLETIRAFAAERLAGSGEEDAARRAHLGWFIRWSDEADAALRGQQPDWLDLFEREHDNLRAALAFAIDHDPAAATRLASSLWDFWQVRGHIAEGRRWLAWAIEADPAGASRWHAQALQGAGVLAWRQGDLPEAERWLRRSLAAWTALGETGGMASASANLGNVLDHQGRLDEAETCHRIALAHARDAGDRRMESLSLNNLAILAHNRGDLAGAKNLLSESLRIKEETGNLTGLPSTLTNLAVIAVDEGDLDAAERWLERALEADRRLGNVMGIADDLGNLGAIAAERGDHLRAITWHREALLLRRETGDWLSIAWSFETIAACAAAAGHPAGAALLYGAAEALRETLGAPIPPPERPRHQTGVDTARAALDSERFAREWATGRALSREEAADLALRLADDAGATGPEHGPDKSPTPEHGGNAPACRG